jgi:muramoyltetrapeptide carboxypeptidase
MSSEKIERGVAYLERLGYRVEAGKHILDQTGYLAGSDEDRADDFNRMMTNKNIKAIFCTRGGYGTPRLLHLIDYQAIKKNPKIVVGYSDITALQLAIWKKTKLVTFSGPMVAVEMWNGIKPYTEEYFWQLLTSNEPLGLIRAPENEPFDASLLQKTARGVLLGGNFALVASLLGTPYAPDFKKAILFLEDTDEAPHRVDRMFAQFRHAKIMGAISGLVLGKFTDCAPSDASAPHFTIDEVLEEARRRSRVPVLSGFAYGHVPLKLTMPIGLPVRLDVKTKGLVFDQSGVL